MSWQNELMNNVTRLEELEPFLPHKLTPDERRLYEDIIERYPMSIPRYYLSLIDPSDPADPIAKLCIPSVDEVDLSGEEDTSGEAENTVITGMQHKYNQTVLILSTSKCAMYCRHCFRKRMVGATEEETAQQLVEIYEYVRRHKEVSNVLISGGDSFLNSNQLIERYLERFGQLEHLDLIRFGTRTPVVYPQRINDDPELLDLLEKYNKQKQINIVLQFNHPREFTPKAIQAVRSLHKTGAALKNQVVLLKGVNDSPEVLAELLKCFTRYGISPYYVFQCRPVLGVKSQFQVPLKAGVDIVEAAKKLQNGQGKCFRYAMSHPTGKIEILGKLPSGEIVFKYAQAKNPRDNERVFTMNIPDNLCWLEDIPSV